MVGWFLPLGCGHNGYFNSNEKKRLEMHLISSGFIDSIVDSSRASEASQRRTAQNTK